VEFVLAGLASQSWKAVVARVKNAVTDWAFLHALKLLIKITLPGANCLSHGTILQRTMSLVIVTFFYNNMLKCICYFLFWQKASVIDYP
jgi:hypothetical protein